MADDLYTEFLEIPPGPRPPNHYEFLALPLFESDEKRIGAALAGGARKTRGTETPPTSPARARAGGASGRME